MRSAFPALALVIALALSGPTRPADADEAGAAAETVTFAVENMTCALCPVTVRTAMAAVDGVQSVEVEFEAGTATVTFDPSLTSERSIAEAATNAGYPARPIEQ